MSSLVALKAFVTVAALGLGAGAVAVTVAVQQNPRLFTSAVPMQIETPYVPRVIPMPPPPVAIAIEPHRAAVVTIPTVTVRARPAPVVHVTAKPSTPDLSRDRVIPAPCRNGEYRMLDERQGVRLMCPGQL